MEIVRSYNMAFGDEKVGVFSFFQLCGKTGNLIVTPFNLLNTEAHISCIKLCLFPEPDRKYL
jgi:hypothetical protein